MLASLPVASLNHNPRFMGIPDSAFPENALELQGLPPADWKTIQGLRKDLLKNPPFSTYVQLKPGQHWPKQGVKPEAPSLKKPKRKR
jgi:hypothetical protein